MNKKIGMLLFVIAIFLVASVVSAKIIFKETASVDFQMKRIDVYIDSETDLKSLLEIEKVKNNNLNGEWFVDNPEIVSVNKNGMMSAKELGRTKVTYDGGKKKNTTQIQVRVLFEPETLSPNSLSLKIGETSKIEAIFPKKYGDDKTGVWKVQDENIASVDQEGNVTGVKKGRTYVIFKSNETKRKTVSLVTIVPIPFSISSKTIEIDLSKSNTAKAEVLYDVEYPNEKVGTWASSDEKIFIVDQSGNINALTLGEAIVSFKDSLGNLATASVRIKGEKSSIPGKFEKPSSIVAKQEPFSHYLNIKVNETVSHSITFVDGNGLNTVLPSESSNPNIATLNTVYQGRKDLILGVSPGTCTFTFMNGNEKHTLHVTVLPILFTEIKDTTISLKQSFAILGAPSGAKTMGTWSVGDESIATIVNQMNDVLDLKPLKIGETTLTYRAIGLSTTVNLKVVE
ncbi:MAG: hypothetical protein K0R71_120 [Bacillales bacterium]|jgi:uncharacterized protein YjdB|nr:hypothetical protein [Bacillales bacterium]